VPHKRLLHSFYGGRYTGRGTTFELAVENAWERAKVARTQAIRETAAEAQAEGVTFDEASKQQMKVEEIRIVGTNPVSEYKVVLTPD
jgi:hypothetical protein